MSDFLQVLSTLRQVRVLGGHFALDVGRPDDEWSSGADILSGDALPVTLDKIFARYRTDERRVAGSLFLIGFAARVLSPVVAAHAVKGAVPDIRPENLWWHYGPQGLRVRLYEPVEAEHDIADSLAPVVEAVHRETRVARGLLWGNVGSTIAGALRMLARNGTAPVDRCHRLGERLLEKSPLSGTGEFTPLPDDLAFRRRSCCLYYRLEGGGTCGDCPIEPK
ncbi:hypothetical protein GCM10022243_59220 [Saccharothrix violaceirubra]|uniref:Ferric iron reductase protein FhuF n=1 Tax=Saccharothrix violaceirubra TaxID=413306 RepID=A0A7W7T1R6_9PSEU|nr:(2Fe-2S)-binding protein [Saccharothrix violaceirubra]MBB4964960.1 ferric iron reductase protein FhuF [Saccharothrix violaceirubra]